MENYPLISVIIPSRMNESIDSLESVKKQTYPNIETIVQYDEHASGSSATRNAGARKAKGKYYFFCDNDINLLPNTLMHMYEKLIKNDAKWCFGRVVIDGNDVTQRKGKIPENKNSEEYIMYFHGISTMSLIDASVNPIFDEKLRRFEDWDLWIRLDKAGHKGVFLDEVILTTVNRPWGISAQNDAEKWMRLLFEKHGLFKKKADIIIPHHNRHDLLKNCLEKIDNKKFNIIVVSGGTFSENCNKGARLAETDNLIFLNDDVEPIDEALVALAESEYELCGISQYDSNNRKFYGIGWRYDGKSCATSFYLTQQKDGTLIPSGYCFKIKKYLWEKLGGLSELYRNGAEDCELGLSAIEHDAKIGFIDFPMLHKHSQSDGRYAFAFDNNNIFDSRWTREKIERLKILAGEYDYKSYDENAKYKKLIEKRFYQKKPLSKDTFITLFEKEARKENARMSQPVCTKLAQAHAPIRKRMKNTI